MIVTYILYLFLATDAGVPVAVNTTYYQGQLACENAKFDIQEAVGGLYDELTVVCVPQSK